MNTFRFLSETWARRFARNARGRGYAVKVAGHVVTVDPVDRRLSELVRRYAGVPIEGVKS